MGGSTMSVGGLQFTKKTYIIFIIIGVLAIAGVVGYLSMQPSTAKKVKDSETVTITILDSIAVDRVTITNRDTGKSIVKTYIDLPYAFNVSRGDTVKISTTMQYGYQYDAIEFKQVGTFDHKNPAQFVADGKICLDNKIVLNIAFIDLEISPTFSPSPTPSPTPVE
jgi:hypothetical protein